VISGQEIKDQGAQSAADALQRVPGININSAGSPADDNDIRIMGSDRDEVLVLVDGVPINTVLDNRPTIIGSIPAENIERIEILEGAHSGMYGSRAVGGVVNIITKEGEEGFSTDAGFKAGNLGRFIENAGISLGKGKHRLRLNYERWDQAGRFQNDRFGQNTASINWKYDLSDELSIQFSPQYFGSDQQLAFDSITEGNVVFYPRDTNRKLWRDTVLVPLSLTLNMKRWWEMDFDYSYYYQYFKLVNSPAGDTTPGAILGDQYARSNEDRHRFNLRNTFTPLDQDGFRDLVTLGFDVDVEHLTFVNGPFGGPHMEFPLPDQKFDRENYAVFLQNVTHFKEYVSLVVGFRYDKNTMFGSEPTFRGSIAARIPQSKTTFKLSYSDTFNAPLITLFVFNLQPQKETARNYSAGVEQDLWGKGNISSFFFYKDYGSLFFDSADAVGTDNAYAMGVETSLELTPLGWLAFNGSYTWTKARDRTRGVPLPDRPAHVWKASLTVEPIERLIFRADLAVVGEQYWGTNTGLTFVDWQGRVSNGKLKGYVKLDLGGRYTFNFKNKIIPEFTLFTTVENALNQSYEQEFGRPEPGINFLSGLSAKLF
ncbi:MAG: TonB-dependent receptor, partial [bacterium]